MSQLANITKVPLLPVITIAKTSGVYTYNPFISTFDFAVGSLSVSPAFDAVGGTFSLQIIGSSGTNAQMNTILSNISEGNEVTIWVGKSNATKIKIFLGVIEDIEIVEPNKNFMIVTLSGPDFGSDILKNTVVLFQYEQRLTSLGEVDTTDGSTSIINLVSKILNDTQSYPNAAIDGITAVTKGIVYDATKVLPLDYQIPVFNARYDFLDDKLQELDDYGLSYHYVDADKNFIMSQLNVSTSSAPASILFTDDVNDSTTWVSGKVGLIAPNSNFKRTLEHHKRRVFGLGGLSSELDQQNTTTTTSTVMSANYIAQRFRPNKTTLSKINLYISRTGTPTNDLVLELRDDSSGGTSLPIGEVRRSISKNKTILSDKPVGEVTLTSFEMNEELTPGRDYWIVLFKNGTDSANTFNWHKDALDTGTSATSADDQTWNLTTTPNRFNYAFQAFLGNELIAVSTEANTVVSSKHFHEDTIRKSDIINNELLKIILLQENKTTHKKKEILKCMIYAPDTLLSTGQKIRVRKQLSGYVIDGDFTLGQIEYVFESGEDTSTGNFYYNVELTRFVDFA